MMGKKSAGLTPGAAFGPMKQPRCDYLRTKIASSKPRNSLSLIGLLDEEAQRLAGVPNKRRKVDTKNNREHRKRQHQGEIEITRSHSNRFVFGIGRVEKHRLDDLRIIIERDDAVEGGDDSERCKRAALFDDCREQKK